MRASLDEKGIAQALVQCNRKYCDAQYLAFMKDWNSLAGARMELAVEKSFPSAAG
jgi:hypothetical protein